MNITKFAYLSKKATTTTKQYIADSIESIECRQSFGAITPPFKLPDENALWCFNKPFKIMH